MAKEIDVPGLIELIRRKHARIVQEVADKHLGDARATVDAVLHARLDGIGFSPADIAEWAHLISNGHRPSMDSDPSQVSRPEATTPKPTEPPI